MDTWTEYTALLKSITNKDVRESILDMFEDIQERVFSAPASHRASYHNCFPGGLSEHSIRVYNILKNHCENFAPEIPQDSIIITALLHDLGKIGSMTEPYYVPQRSSWHQEKLGEFYTHNDNLMYMGTAQRSLRLLGQYGVNLTEDEYQAILIHDGQYIDENAKYKNKECTLALLLHQADMLACKMEKARYEKWVEANA